jgi:hypothetical protein
MKKVLKNYGLAETRDEALSLVSIHTHLGQMGRKRGLPQVRTKSGVK